MNTYCNGDDNLPSDLQDVLVIPLSDSGAFQKPLGTCQVNWNDHYPNYGNNNLFALNEGRSDSRSQNDAENVYSPYTETPSSSFGPGNGMSPNPSSSSSLLSRANYNSHIDEFLLPEEDNSLRPAWCASAIMPGAASSSFTMLREDTESSAHFMHRGGNDGMLMGGRTLDNLLQIPSWDTPLSDNFQVSSQNDLYHQNEYLPNTDAVSGNVTHEHFSNNLSFPGGESVLSLDSVLFEQVSGELDSDHSQKIRRSKQKPRQRLTKEEYSKMTPEQMEAFQRKKASICSKEYRSRKKQEQDGHIRDLEEQAKLNEELNEKHIALERQKKLIKMSLERMNKDFGNLELLKVSGDLHS